MALESQAEVSAYLRTTWPVQSYQVTEFIFSVAVRVLLAIFCSAMTSYGKAEVELKCILRLQFSIAVTCMEYSSHLPEIRYGLPLDLGPQNFVTLPRELRVYHLLLKSVDPHRCVSPVVSMGHCFHAQLLFPKSARVSLGGRRSKKPEWYKGYTS